MFHTILIANRGEIAVRIMRTCHALGIRTVAIYSEADRTALHVRRADQARLVGPAPAARSYLRVDAIIAAALDSGAQAIHPGYGFLSERAELARACREAGLVFIGPPPEAIALMGSKSAARQLAARAGVPVVPGYDGDDQSDARLHAEAERIGVPVLVKASAGGGGRGMRTVMRLEELGEALAGARREAGAAFGDDRVLLERLILRPRHVEIQVLGDHHGSVVHLGERDCSIQRRHQKVVEEAPSPALTTELRARMGEAAVRLARAAGYQNAGTCEFILDEDGSFYFLEMNTRLQVEHPVTELVTGVDLVELQIRVAAGEHLPFDQAEIHPVGHAIEVRVTAEDPHTYLPAAGTIGTFQPPDGPGVRNDLGFVAGDSIGLHYDSLVAKLIVYGQTRGEAIERLREALEHYTITGLTTNLPLLRHIAAHPEFAAGEARTDFLVRYPLPPVTPPPAPPAEALLAALGAELLRRGMDTPRRLPEDRPAVSPWEHGPWRMARAAMPFRYAGAAGEHLLTVSAVSAGWHVTIDQQHWLVHELARRGDDEVVVICDDLPPIVATIRAGQAGHVEVIWRGQRHTLRIPEPPDVDELGPGHGHAHAHANLTAPMPGTVTRVLVSPGERVTRGQPLIAIEAMKMEHTVAAPYDGTVVAVPFRSGDLVAGGAMVVELEED